MDTQLANYIILKNGKCLKTFRPSTLEMAVQVVRHLEAMMDRNKQHSPYTIGRKNGGWNSKAGGEFDNGS